MEKLNSKEKHLEIGWLEEFKSLILNCLSAMRDSFKYTHKPYLAAKIFNYNFQGFILKYLLNIDMHERVNKLKKWIIFDTPFGKYFCTTVSECKMIRDNYEQDIYEVIKRINSNELDTWEKYCIDVWANIWRWAIDLAKNLWYKVIAFEPAPWTYTHLVKNIELSEMWDNIESYNIWLWKGKSELPFLIWDIWDTTAHIDDKDFDHWCRRPLPMKRISVHVDRFDDIWIDSQKIKNTKLILIDVEWFELNVLKWMSESIKSMWDVKLIVEIWHDQKKKEEILNFMQKLWFRAKQINRDNRLFSRE